MREFGAHIFKLSKDFVGEARRHVVGHDEPIIPLTHPTSETPQGITLPVDIPIALRSQPIVSRHETLSSGLLGG